MPTGLSKIVFVFGKKICYKEKSLLETKEFGDIGKFSDRLTFSVSRVCITNKNTQKVLLSQVELL